jgi:hypothetical protein
MIKTVIIFAGLGFAGFMSLQTDQKATAVKVETPDKVTYAEHVAPIINKHCISCHRPGEVAPFSLVGFDAAKKQHTMIASAADAKRMPPWKAVEGYGDFKGENRLSAQEIAILKKWSIQNAVRGDAKKEPPTPVFPKTEWSHGTPDKVLQLSKPFELEAEGPDVYRNFVFDLGNKEDVYIKALDVRPGNKSVVHHVIGFLDASGKSVDLEKNSPDDQDGYSSSGGGIGLMPSGALGGWAPGVMVQETEPGVAFKVAPGTKIVLQIHYHKSGKPEKDQTKVALYYAKEKIERTQEIFWAANPMFRIPPGVKSHAVNWSTPLPADATIYTVMPHMHLLGKSMKAHVVTPQGNKIPLVWVDSWDFNWQLVYTLKQPLEVKRGSRLVVNAVYDNSTDNPHNPNDPPKPITWGEETTDEMALLVVGYSVNGGGKPRRGG